MKGKLVTVATAAIVTSAFGATTAFADSYTVQQGDTLTQIAKKFNTTVSNLKQWNGLKSDRINVKQTLSISKPASVEIKSTEKTSTYTVVPGDTLLKIANKYEISLAELMTWNQLKSSLIRSGQVLKVSESDSVEPKPVVASSTPIASTQQDQKNTSVYSIKRGDTLSKIAAQFGTTVSQLKALNNLSSNMIYAGSTLKVSGQPVKQSETKTETVAKAPTTANASTTEYVIKSGDTLGKIAAQFSISVQSIKSLNGLSSDLIFAGQKLKVSGTVSTSSPSVKEKNVQPPAPVEKSIASASVDTLINEAKKMIGVPYKWGGTTPSGFDCSGFIFYVYDKAGYDISRNSAQGYFDRSYYVDKPQVGDLVFFKNTYKQGISHVGIYVGNNQFINASSDGVEITSLGNSYWSKHFDSYKRFY
jgi:LysM repeat protein